MMSDKEEPGIYKPLLGGDIYDASSSLDVNPCSTLLQWLQRGETKESICPAAVKQQSDEILTGACPAEKVSTRSSQSPRPSSLLHYCLILILGSDITAALLKSNTATWAIARASGSGGG